MLKFESERTFLKFKSGIKISVLKLLKRAPLSHTSAAAPPTTGVQVARQTKPLGTTSRSLKALTPFRLMPRLCVALERRLISAGAQASRIFCQNIY